MKYKSLALTILATSMAQTTAAYDVIINGTSVYSGSTVIDSVSVQQTGSQLILTTSPNVTISTSGGGTPTPVAPVFTSSANRSVAENSTSVGVITATDGNGDPITYSLTGGADQSKFSLSGSTLSFVSAPDYEVPTDNDSNNTYLVQLTASDGGLSAIQNMTVTVTDVSEGAPGNCPTVAGVTVNRTLDLTTGTPQFELPLGSDALAMKFNLDNGSALKTNQFSFASKSGTAGVVRDMWIAECPGTTPNKNLGNACHTSNNTNASLNLVNKTGYDSYGYCSLDASKEYYLIIKNRICTSGTCPVYIEIK